MADREWKSNRCGEPTERDGNPCTLWSARGDVKCKAHGGVRIGEKPWVPNICDALIRIDEPDGARCRKRSVRGTNRCQTHGGASPQALRLAVKRLQAIEISKDLVTYGLPQDTDPTEAFLSELARTNGHVLWLAERIQALPENEMIWGIVERTEKAGSVPENNWSEEKVGAMAHIWLGMYFRERQHLVKIADAMIKNGLTEMQLRLNARLVDVFEGAMIGMLTDLRLDPTDPAVRTIIAHRMGEAATLAAQPLAIEKATR